MTQFNREETITLVSKNPGCMALFMARAMGEGYQGFAEGALSPMDLTLAFLGASEILALFVSQRAHEIEPYRNFVAELIDSGAIEVTGEIGRISDLATPQTPRTVN